jgi:hypothetical protein
MTGSDTAKGAKPDAPGEGISKPAPRSSGESRMNRIARRAHEIYVARGGAHGKALEDWLQAEREIDAEIDRSGG